MAIELFGLEALYEAPPQLKGVEVEFDDLAAQQPNGPLFIASCTVTGLDRDWSVSDTGTLADVGVVGVSGADQAVFDDNNGYWGPVATEQVSGHETWELPFRDFILVTEVATGIETFDLTASETLDRGPAEETATGNELAVAPGGVDDTGSGAEEGTIGIIATDVATGIETFELTASETLDRPGSDTGSGNDQGVVTAFVSGADQAIFAETGTVGVSGADQAVGVEAGVTTAAVSGIETLSVVEAVEFPYKDENAFETGSGVETAFLSAADWFADDTGTGAETGTPGIVADETAAGAEQTVVGQMNDANETPSFTDTALAEVAVPIEAFDTMTFVDLACAAPSGDFFVSKTPRLGPEIYWPSWANCHTNISLSGSINRTFNFYQFWAEEQVYLDAVVQESYRRRWLAMAPVRENRCQWVTSFAPGDTQEFTLRYQAETPMGPVTGSVRQAISRFDYEQAVDPVWWVDGLTRKLVIRNLHMRESRRTSFNGVYSLCMELYGLTPDSGVYWRRHPDQTWEWIDAESATLSGTHLTLPLTGTLFFAWGSEMVLRGLETGTVTIEWHGGRTVEMPVTRRDTANRFDHYGILAGLPRLYREDNLTYKRRLLAYSAAPGDPTLPGVVRGVAARIGTIGFATWNGVSILTLDTDGASGVSQITVAGVPRYREVEEFLLPVSGVLYYARYPNWREGWLVMVDGVPEPGVSVSGNVVRLTREVSGAVTAVYAIEQYSFQAGPSGTIQALLPGTGLVSGGYRVVFTRHVRAYNAGDESYQEDQLLDVRGLPNRSFYELANKLQESNPTVFARARWGMSASWLDADGDLPQSARLPIPMDVNLTSTSGTI